MDNLKDYWSEWAAGEIEAGNETVGLEFGDASVEGMDTFKDYVKAVKALNVSLNDENKELRNDIADAVAVIIYDGGGFEDYTFDVLTADQFTKIQDII